VRGTASAAQQGQKKLSFTKKVKAAVAKIGTGQETRVEINLGNHTIMKGYISEAKEDEFMLVDPKRSVTVTVPYSQVKVIRGNNTRTDTRVSVSNHKPSPGLFLVIGGMTVVVIILARALSAPN
jgi:hypothetical protein